MNIRRKVFSSISENDIISEIEERAFAEGYDAAINNADIKDYRLYEQDEKDRKRRRRVGHILGAAGTVGAVTNLAAIETGLRTGAFDEFAGKKVSRWGTRAAALAVPVAAIGTGLYKINKKSNKSRTFEEYMQDQEKGEH